MKYQRKGDKMKYWYSKEMVPMYSMYGILFIALVVLHVVGLG